MVLERCAAHGRDATEAVGKNGFELNKGFRERELKSFRPIMGFARRRRRLKVKRLSLLLAIVMMIAAPTLAQKKVMLMNRIGPSQSTLYIANADGTGEHPLVPYFRVSTTTLRSRRMANGLFSPRNERVLAKPIFIESIRMAQALNV